MSNTTVNPATLNPAENLSGVMLPGGWKVGDRIRMPKGSTGGNFSCCYTVEHENGQKAFLKALDYSAAFESGDPAREIQRMTEAYNFERDVLNVCRENGLDRVVRAITDGKVKLEGMAAGGLVEYLIFELADYDVRAHLAVIEDLERVWRLRCLHHIATGLKQLHSAGLAHQDVKPSNVLVFDGNISKVGDLGRAARKGFFPPHDSCDCAGDLSYGPPELLYGYVDPDWAKRRQGCDMYLLGSMVMFLLAGVSATAILMGSISREHHWRVWRGSFDEVLPYLQQGFDRVLDLFSNEIPEGELRDELTAIVKELCDPDPNTRGDKINRSRKANPYSLERYITRFDVLARKASIGTLRR